MFLWVAHCYSVALAAVVSSLITFAGLWETRKHPQDDSLEYVRPGIDNGRLDDLLFLGPFVESILIIGIIEVLRWLRFGTGAQVGTSACAIFLVHVVDFRYSAISLLPVFLIHGATYIYWRRVSFLVGVQMIIGLHFLFNLMPAMTVIWERLRQ